MKINEEKYYLSLLEKEPDNAKAAFSLGTIYLHAQDGRRALKWLEKAFSLKPDWAVVQNNLGKTYELLGDDIQARIFFEKAAQLDPNLAEAWFNLAEADSKAGYPERALDHYCHAIRISPEMIAAHNNMGNLLKNMKRYPEAIEAFCNVVRLNPNLAQGHYNLGSTYRLIEQFPKAVVHLSEAIKIEPDYADAWNNLALTCKNIGDLKRALTYLMRALQIDPGLAVARWNRSFVHFLMGNWSKGWKDFEARFDVPHWSTIYPHRIEGRLWDGRPAPGQVLLVHDEQGLGDTFQFVRLLPWVRQRCSRLIFETRRELVPLLESFPGIDDLIIRSDKGPPTVSFDQYVPLMSLGRIMNIDPDDMTSMTPYLKAPQDKIIQWRSRMSSKAINVGLVWSGRPEHGNDANRSCGLELFEPLFDLPEFNFIGLQKGPAAAQARQMTAIDNFANWGDDLDSFADTAGIIHHLDLVITVDTSVAHLAGAMGRPVWVLLPFIPDWRWGMQGTKTGWYSSMQLLRQPAPKAWGPVIQEIKRMLEKNHQLFIRQRPRATQQFSLNRIQQPAPRQRASSPRSPSPLATWALRPLDAREDKGGPALFERSEFASRPEVCPSGPGHRCR